MNNVTALFFGGPKNETIMEIRKLEPELKCVAEEGHEMRIVVYRLVRHGVFNGKPIAIYEKGGDDSCANHDDRVHSDCAGTHPHGDR